MRYYPLVHHPEQGLIWNLFSDLPQVMKKLGSRKEGQKGLRVFDPHTLEIIRSARTGSIDLHQKFYLNRYIVVSNKRKLIQEFEEAKGLTPILPGFKYDDDEWSDGIREDKLPAQCSDSVPGLTYRDEFETNLIIEEIDILTAEYSKYGFSLRATIDNAFSGSPTASDNLREILSTFPEIHQQVLDYLGVLDV